MEARFTGIEAEIERMRGGVRKLEKQGITEVKVAARKIMNTALANTPVWQGTAVRNYRWVIGSGAMGGEAVALGSGDPGPTNTMPMGSEPRRGANESVARAEMESALGTIVQLGPPVRFSNTAHHFDLVDSGSAPTGARARNPGGVMKLAEASGRGENWK